MPLPEERIYKSYPEPVPSSTKWIILFFVIFLGVTAGNLTSNWITAKVAEYQLKKSLEAISKQLKIDTERSKQEQEQLKIRNARIAEEQKRHQQQQAEARKREQEKKRQDAEARKVTRQKQIQTCQFWIEEYAKTRSEVDMHHRNNACRDAQTTTK